MSQVILTDEEILTQLNNDYVNSFLKGDARRYDEFLDKDFVSIYPNGQLISRAQFLADNTEAATVEFFHVEDVKIRLFGDTAQVYARTPYKWIDGREGVNCYIDTYIKRDGEWKCISGHVSRVQLS